MLRTSLKTGVVADIWRKSFVRPVHKNGAKNKIDNYRGVALQCVIPKLLDSIIANHLNFHMKNIIDDSQHGFVKGKSTTSNLTEFVSNTLCNMEKHMQTDAIYIDIAKAFDSVNVKLLIHKLNIMGLNTQLLNWIESYLQHRMQIVKLNETMSSPIDVTSGTGQGYPVGATLFVLFLIDLPRQIKNSIIQSFADDTRVSKCITKYDDCLELQADLDELANYFKRNQLKLNVMKSKSVSYHRGMLVFDFKYRINNEYIEQVDVIKDLGIILDTNLTFSEHIEYITAKAKSRLAWIKHFGREFEDPWTIKKLYSTFVMPIIECGSQVWNPHTADKITKIESIQKQFLLYALRKLNWPQRFRLPSYKNRLLLLQMITLEDRRKIAQIKFIHNVILGNISSKHILDKIKIRTPHHRTRNKDLLELPTRRADYSKFEPINYMLNTYNQFYSLKLPNCDNYLIDFNVNIVTIKLRLIEYFKNNLS